MIDRPPARATARARTVALVCLLALALGGCVNTDRNSQAPTPAPPSTGSGTGTVPPTPSPSATLIPEPPSGGAGYPWHTGIVSTTFWVGEIFDPNAEDGSQMISTYDSDWYASYGGCDGVALQGGCETEVRGPSNGYFPSAMTPLQNPFYLDLPFDDINDDQGFATRDSVVPWASQEPYVSHRGDRQFSYLKNRWVQLTSNGVTCYGQIEDAGPGEYHDAAYVFGTDDARPANTRYGGAGMDVSPALTGCLGFPEINGQSGVVDWRFVDEADVPAGPWLTLVTTSPVR